MCRKCVLKSIDLSSACACACACVSIVLFYFNIVTMNEQMDETKPSIDCSTFFFSGVFFNRELIQAESDFLYNVSFFFIMLE